MPENRDSRLRGNDKILRGNEKNTHYTPTQWIHFRKSDKLACLKIEIPVFAGMRKYSLYIHTVDAFQEKQ
jgi:myo-inositol-1-phosphate synthase